MAKTKTNKNTKGSFKEMTKEDLKKELVSLKEGLRVIHFKAEGARSKNVKEAGTLKKQIARVLTELNTKK